ncbi:ectonucleotide pyrophosphatase/phosphodiesterase [Novosphingobium sp.]|uniref:alkaline phosphatase family protein n=1 Tax=Novosphingobium sp. TaxID=1874826 RepID=UPI00333F355C
MANVVRAAVLLLLMIAAPAHADPAASHNADPAPLILVSIDGFRADYLDRGVSPMLSALAASGVRADAMIPAFPSVTFPNHTTLVTGLYPDHHGIVNNSFRDAVMPGAFSMASKEDAWWAQNTPIWVTAERAGLHTGVMFWPGVAVAHQGTRPGLFQDYDRKIAAFDRVDTVLGWLDLPVDQRPRLALLYFEAVDSAGHNFGPDSPQVNAAITAVDGAVTRLVAGLNARGLAANLMIVADHGMAAVGADNLVVLDDVTDLGAVSVVFDGTVVGVAIPHTRAGKAARGRLLANQPHMHCWDKAAMPADLHYGTNARVPNVMCQVATGWLAMTRDERTRAQAFHPGGEKGAHGYDIHDPAMGALFIANGPAFRARATVAAFPNVDVYPLMAKVLGIAPLPNDGNLADVAGVLKPAQN